MFLHWTQILSFTQTHTQTQLHDSHIQLTNVQASRISYLTWFQNLKRFQIKYIIFLRYSCITTTVGLSAEFGVD